MADYSYAYEDTAFSKGKVGGDEEAQSWGFLSDSSGHVCPCCWAFVPKNWRGHMQWHMNTETVYVWPQVAE